MRDLNALEGLFDELMRCCLHDPQWTLDQAAETVAWWEDDTGCWAESESVIVVRLKNGDYGLLTQWEDSSGHGCRCDSMTVRENSLHKILTHLEERELLKLIGDTDG